MTRPRGRRGERTDLPRRSPLTPIVGGSATRVASVGLAPARRGREAVVTRQGPAGIGKTRLAAEVAATASEGWRGSELCEAPPRSADGLRTWSPERRRRTCVLVLDDLEGAAPADDSRGARACSGRVRFADVVRRGVRRRARLSRSCSRLRADRRRGAMLRPQPLGSRDPPDRRAVRRPAVDALPSGCSGRAAAFHGVCTSRSASGRTTKQPNGSACSPRRRQQAGATCAPSRATSPRASSTCSSCGSRRGCSAPGRDAARRGPQSLPYKGLAASTSTTRSGSTVASASSPSSSRARRRFLLGGRRPSGSGKSSAVRAGLVPSLRRASFRAATSGSGRAPPGAHPLRELDRALWSPCPSGVAGARAARRRCGPRRRCRDGRTTGPRGRSVRGGLHA